MTSRTSTPSAAGSGPWAHDERWRTGRIVDSPAWATAGVVWAAALFWLGLLTIGSTIVALSEDARLQVPPAAVAFLVFFYVIGLLLALWAAVITLRNLRYGKSSFEMERVPGVIGGALAGVVKAPAGLALARPIEVALECRSWHLTRHGHGSSWRLVWSAQASIEPRRVTQTAAATEIPIAFEIPADCPPTDGAVNPNTRIEWVLLLRASVSGIDWVGQYTVPVYAAATS